MKCLLTVQSGPSEADADRVSPQEVFDDSEANSTGLRKRVFKDNVAKHISRYLKAYFSSGRIKSKVFYYFWHTVYLRSFACTFAPFLFAQEDFKHCCRKLTRSYIEVESRSNLSPSALAEDTDHFVRDFFNSITVYVSESLRRRKSR